MDLTNISQTVKVILVVGLFVLLYIPPLICIYLRMPRRAPQNLLLVEPLSVPEIT
jgi:hypothetical protein